MEENKKLTVMENKLLAYLKENRGRIISQQKLLQVVWGNSFLEGDMTTVRVHINRLRKKLPDERPRIRTYPKKGYGWVPQASN